MLDSEGIPSQTCNGLEQESGFAGPRHKPCFRGSVLPRRPPCSWGHTAEWWSLPMAPTAPASLPWAASRYSAPPPLLFPPDHPLILAQGILLLGSGVAGPSDTPQGMKPFECAERQNRGCPRQANHLQHVLPFPGQMSFIAVKCFVTAGLGDLSPSNNASQTPLSWARRQS